MIFEFTKMHGAGNDFILACAPVLSEKEFEKIFTQERIAFLCDRHLGIGGDGFIFVRALPDRIRGIAAAQMQYFNSDGGSAAMCGNGLRCAASFAYRKGLLGKEKKMCFLSGGLEAYAEILDEENKVRIQLEVTEDFQEFSVSFENDAYRVFKGAVGVPHAVVVLNDPEKWEALDVRKFGAFLRYHPLFAPTGVNADFLFFREGKKTCEEVPVVLIRTYERGVEEETLCCGTGCSASAVVLGKFFSFPEKLRLFCRKGDEIGIEIMKEWNILKGVLLSGPAETVFEGRITFREDD